MSEAKKELKEFLEEQKLKTCQVAVFPDFFLDRFINLKLSLVEFSRLAASVAKRKGGSIDGISQTEMRGGNAINVASALANLGVKIAPIVCTNEHGLIQLNYFLKDLPVDSSFVKIRDKASITTALEFQDKKAKTNVMLRDLGSLENFGPADLDDKDYRIVEDADFVCVFNWAGTLRFGTALAEAVFSRSKKNGKGKTYYDTADPTPNSHLIPELIGKVLNSNHVDILSVNESEAVTYARYLDEGFPAHKEHEFAVLAMEAARILKKHLPSRIDLHTSLFSATLRDKTEVVVPAFKVKILRATGAGDAWTAGNILGDHNGLSDECRLMLANAVSACYLSDPKGNHPTWEKIRSFLTDKI